MDPLKARINEIKFLELCTRIESVNHRMIDIKRFLGCIHNFFEFDLELLTAASEQIFMPRCAVVKEEISALLATGEFKTKELAETVNMSDKTLYRYKNKLQDNVLYPRLDEQFQEELEKFIEQYDRYFTRDFRNIVRW